MPADITPQPPAQVAGRVAEIIRAHPASHDQTEWVVPGDGASSVRTTEILAGLADPGCGTTCCAAGLAVAVAAPPGTEIIGAGRCGLTGVVLPDGTLRDIATYAGELLGLPASYNLNRLFHDQLSPDEVLAELDRIAAGGDPNAR